MKFALLSSVLHGAICTKLTEHLWSVKKILVVFFSDNIKFQPFLIKLSHRFIFPMKKKWNIEIKWWKIMQNWLWIRLKEKNKSYLFGLVCFSIHSIPFRFNPYLVEKLTKCICICFSTLKSLPLVNLLWDKKIFHVCGARKVIRKGSLQKPRVGSKNPKGISNSLESQEKFLLSLIPFLFVFPKGVKKWYPLEFGTGFDY